MSILKTIAFIGSLLGLIAIIISYIGMKKIQKKFEEVTDDELITEEDERRTKGFLILLIIGLIVTPCMSILSLIIRGMQLFGRF